MGLSDHARTIVRQCLRTCMQCALRNGLPRGKVNPGEPVTIRALKRFVNDWSGVYDGTAASSTGRFAFSVLPSQPADFDLENSALRASLAL